MWIVCPQLAVAQEVAGGAVPDLNAQTFRSSVDARRTLWVDDGRPRATPGLAARALVHYVDDPLLYRDQDDRVTRLVASVLQTDLVGGFTVGPARLGAVVPVYLLTTSDVAPTETGLGDVGLDGKLALIRASAWPVDLALGARVSFPTATVAGALGSPTTGYELAAIASRELGPALLALNVGTRGGPRTVLENIEVDDFLVVRGAGAFAFTDDRGAAVELAWQVPYAASFANPSSWPLEGIASGYSYVGRDLVVRGGLGRGVTRGIGSPAARVVIGVGYEPRGDGPQTDRDLDGVADAADRCRSEPEDADGFEDLDGCPDPDDDEDGVLDRADLCRDGAEDRDGWSDDDGCPEPTTVHVEAVDPATGEPIAAARVGVTCGETATTAIAPVDVEVPAGLCTLSVSAPGYARAELASAVAAGPPISLRLAIERQARPAATVTRERIELSESIRFRPGRAEVDAASLPVLDAAVRALAEYPEIRRLRIEGHTDERGAAAGNLLLSQARAKAVLDAFVARGIDPGRLVSVGYGESRPLDPGHTEDAWSRNRRTDFFIEEWGEPR